MARRFSLGWLKPPAVPEDGVMSLADHLRELRYRMVFSMVFVVLGMIGCAFFYQQLVQLLMQPYTTAGEILAVTNPGINMQATINDVTQPFLFALQVVGLAGIVLTSPVWVYQAWAYIVPALVAKERKYALMFLGAAIPLFLLGVAAAYWVLPQGIVVMMQFTPLGIEITNLIEISNFLRLLIIMMLAFGIGFLTPVFVVGLNMLGILPAAALKNARPYVVFGCFVFAAAATPGGDPFSMVALAIPMALLFFVAEYLCRLNERRRGRRSSDEIVAA